MPLRLLRTFGLAWVLLLFCLLSCGGDPPADADPCRLQRCDPEGARETVCSPVDETVATTLDQATKFLHEGPNPLQVGLDASVLDPRREAALRGKVTHEGAPVAGATISIAGHPEYGKTLSQCNGVFDLVVNGGGVLVVRIEGLGYLPVRRRVTPRWQTYTVLPEVVLTVADAPVAIDLAAGGAAQASLVQDKDGERRATLLFPPGTVATVNGAPLGPALHVRATEYTVGVDGPKKMPATLPPSSGYTYAVEYSFDEAAEGQSVTFDRPVPAYVDNFLKMPVGTRVPAGFYDKEQEAWIPSDDGRVIKIVGVRSGLAEVDSDGDEVADDALGMSQQERAQLASLYQDKQTLWRVPLNHFSSWDFNWPFGLPKDAIAALAALQDLLHTDDADGACKTSGSIIDCESQILGEAFPLRGTPFALHYSSDRVPGRKAAYTLKLHVLPVPKPASLKRIDVTLSVAGQLMEQHFDCTASSGCDAQTTATFTWDGKDVYGRTVQGRQPAEVRIGYAYDGVYEAAAPGGFGQPGSGVAITGSLTRQEVSLDSVWHGYLGTWRAAPEGLGGFSLDVHHRYDPVSQTLYFGNGEKETAPSLAQVISLAAGGCLTGCNETLAKGVELALPQGVAVAADGSIFIAETNQHRIRRVTPEGFITTVAGTGEPGALHFPQGLAIGAEGALYIADTGNHRVVVRKDGQLTPFAGHGEQTYDASQEGGPATQAAIGDPVAVAVGAEGSLFIADGYNHRVLRVDPGGKIEAFAEALGDLAGVAVGKDGSVYVAEAGENRVRRIRPDGIIEAFAGTGTAGFSGDGGAATSAALHFPRGLAVGADGSVYIADSFNNRVRRVGPEGIIQTVAGIEGNGDEGDGGPATAAKLNEPRGLAVAPDGSLFVGDVARVRRLDAATALPGYTGVGDIVIPSSDGALLYLFSAAGQHRQTLDATTGARLLSFSYTDGLLTSITDDAQNETRILRTSREQVEIVSPFDKRTTLSMFSSGAAQGYLRELKSPGGKTVTFSYGDAGLMATLTDPKKQDYTFHYDAEGLGRLELDEDPAGGSKSLSRTEEEGTKLYSVDVTTAVSADPAWSVTTTHQVEAQGDGSERRTVTRPDGLAVETVSTPDGKSQTTYVDGTVVTVARAGDPRFGMQAPYAKEMTIATGGKTLSLVMSREAALSDPKDPLSLSALTESVSVNGHTFTRAFDAAARKFTNTSPEGRETYTWLDANGRVVGVQQKGLAKTTLAYDDKGRLWTVTQEHPTTPALSRTSTLQYRPTDGELDFIQDTEGAQFAKFDYKSGWVSAITVPDGTDGTRTTGFGHDDNGNLTTLTPPGKPAHTFEPTLVDLVSRYTPPAIDGVADPSTTYLPTLDKRPGVIILPGGELIQAGYAQDGTLHTITTTTAGPAYDLTLNVTPASDPDPNKRGKLESIVGPTPGSEIHFTYEGLLETGSTTKGVLPGGTEIALGRTFYDELRVKTETVNGSTVLFEYDDDSVLWRAGPLTITRDPVHGLVTGTTLESGGHTITDTLTPTPFGEPDLYTAQRDGVEIFRIDYEPFDRHGQLRKKTETIQGGTPHVFEYGYDKARQLSSYKKDGGAETIFTFDPNGSRTGPGWGLTDDQDRLPNSPAASAYTYNDNGELSTKTAGGQITTYGYDLLKNLRTVQRPAPAALITYGIDGLNRRVSKAVGGVLQRVWAYDGGRIVAEFDGAGKMTARFVYGTRPQVPDTMIQGSELYRLLTDHLGSVRLVVRLSDGKIVQQLAYDPWGEVETDTNPGFQPFGFAGGIYDPDTRLVRFGARDYDPAIGRWTAKDPSGLSGGTNLYAYADNDPVNLLDLTGEHPVVFLMLAGAMEGIAGDLFFQMVVQGKRRGCLDGQELAMAGIMGAVSGGLGGLGAKSGGAFLHGNSKLSTNGQHVYEILRTSAAGETEVFKYGISGGPLTPAGLSVRAETQVRRLNAAWHGDFTFESSIVQTVPGGAGARSQALTTEKWLVDQYKILVGRKPRGNLKP